MGAICTRVTLYGPYLAGVRVHVELRDGRIVSCREIRCVFSGTDRFHEWFWKLYLTPQEPVALEPVEEYAKLAA
jgi:hypothetical protein